MTFSGHKTSELLLGLVTGVCLAANGLSATDSSTAGTTRKPATHLAAGSPRSAPTHAVAKKTGPPTTTSHSTANLEATRHSGTVQSGARRATPQPSNGSTAKTAPNHTTAYASHHKSTPARNRRVRSLTGQQRLARLHLQPERTQEIQQALIREGYLKGDATGQWDFRTHEAMQRYQLDHGFPATGLPEAKSLMKLGLGSHPLPSELDRNQAGDANPGANPGGLPVTPPSPPVSQVTPPL